MEKQKKLKFNLVDVIVILVLLAGIAFVVLRLIGSGFGSVTPPASEESEKPVEEEYLITFYASDSANYIVDHLWKGSPLTDDSITLDLGTLVDYKIGPAQISSAGTNGHMVISELEGYSSVYLMSRVTGIDNGFGVTVNGLRLQIGHSMVVRTKEAKFWVYVYDIQKLEDSPYAG